MLYSLKPKANDDDSHHLFNQARPEDCDQDCHSTSDLQYLIKTTSITRSTVYDLSKTHDYNITSDHDNGMVGG
jgi:hypothetical protein